MSKMPLKYRIGMQLAAVLMVATVVGILSRPSYGLMVTTAILPILAIGRGAIDGSGGTARASRPPTR